MNKSFFIDFFEEKIYKKEWSETTDKNIIIDFFDYFIENDLSIRDKIRLICWKNSYNINKICELMPDEAKKSSNYIKKTLTQLHQKNELAIQNINGLHHYTTKDKGLQVLLVNCSSFARNNEYIKQQTKKIKEFLDDKNDYLTEEEEKLFINNSLLFFQENKNKIIKIINSDDNNRQDYIIYDLDFSDLLLFDYDMAELLLDYPEQTLDIMSETLKSFMDETKKINIRVSNIPDSQNIKIGMQRKNNINKLYSFTGIIRRKSDVKPRLKSLSYLCTNPSCTHNDSIIRVPQFEEKIKTITKCPKCKSSIELINKTLEDSLIIVLEQPLSERTDDIEGQKIHIRINDDMTDYSIYNKMRIGQKVTIIGILKELPKQTQSGSESINYDYIIIANNIILDDCDDNDITITSEDLEQIKELGRSYNCFATLIQNFIPEICGNELIKKALLLQHIGSSFNNQRNDSHILLLGDPSTGKSEMISKSLSYSTRGIYSSGTSSSKVGLTATVIKDELTGSWVLEPGALPRANGGICAVDEIDKMSVQDSDCLTEALEQQKITINKANIHAELSTMTSFLAGANPKNGKFDNNISIIKQISFNPALLSRFDLIFILRDTPNKEKDKELINHILLSYDNNITDNTILSKDFIKKYLYYCKNNFKPVLSQGSKNIIKQYYVSIREQSNSTYNVSFTPRQIKGIIRLASSFAKIKQKDVIDEQDIRFAFDIMNETMSDLGVLNKNCIYDNYIDDIDY